MKCEQFLISKGFDVTRLDANWKATIKELDAWMASGDPMATKATVQSTLLYAAKGNLGMTRLHKLAKQS